MRRVPAVTGHHDNPRPHQRARHDRAGVAGLVPRCLSGPQPGRLVNRRRRRHRTPLAGRPLTTPLAQPAPATIEQVSRPAADPLAAPELQPKQPKPNVCAIRPTHGNGRGAP